MASNTSTGSRFTDIEIVTTRLPACYGYLTAKLVSLEEAVEPICLLNVIPELERFVKLAKKHCPFPNDDKLTKDEAAAFYLYTMEMSADTSFYRLLNQVLRDDDRTKVKPFFSYLKLLDVAANKLPSLKRTVWRGINRDVSDSFKKDQIVTWWSVTSCSASVNVIESFLDSSHLSSSSSQSTLFNIQCLHGKSISSYTCFPNEDEILLMPGTHMRVVSKPLYHHGGLHIVHLEEVGDDDDHEGKEAAKKLSSMKEEGASKASATTKKFVESGVGRPLLQHRNKELEEYIDERRTSVEFAWIGKQLTDDDMKIVCEQLKVNENWKKLGFDGTKISETSIEYLCNTLKSNSKSVAELWLRACCLSARSVKVVIKLLESDTKIEAVNLGYNDIDDVAATYIANMLATNKTLQCLLLDNNKISDDGMELLVNALKQNATLAFFHVHNNQITSRSVRTIVELVNVNRTLQTLDLTSNQLSEKDKKQIKQLAEGKINDLRL
ncbi:unnamed protein product [Didymodactylos carnosus]|uniref:NAD(P)(+)--arginine ADP-ribosyltransferase n=1 Tax=Didymodactylos carnosus TaxID=1234261 RepID=A0A815VBA8_9BILA|nr:unnamed protein product [Didymodactylos carnosus]CAF4391998.1 unnamed protein product [Didymodactylos carnosus]